MKFYIVDNLKPDALAEIPANASIFSHPAWHKTISDSYGFKTYYIMLENQAPLPAVLVAPIMQVRNSRWVSLPFSDHSIPLLNNTINPVDLAAGLNNLRKSLGAKSMEIRWPLPAGNNVFLGEKFYWHTNVLSPDSEALFKTFTQSQMRRNIRRAEREGVVVRFGTTWENMLQYYRLHTNTRHRQGVPVQPMGYFNNLWKNLISQGLGFIALAYKDDQLLAGAVMLHWKKTITYKYGASDPRFWGLRPNNLIMWETMRWGCKNGFQIFDWGRTDLEDEGLRDFKLGWGSREKILQYATFADQPFRSAKNNMLSKTMYAVIKHSPVGVCRVLGEMFYRFAA